MKQEFFLDPLVFFLGKNRSIKYGNICFLLLYLVTLRSLFTIMVCINTKIYKCSKIIEYE